MGIRLALDAEQLLAKARELTGIDLVDHDAVEPLRVMVRSLNEESNLHASGAVAMQDRLLRLLCNRLRLHRDLAGHPEIRDQQVRAPIVICGMGRTGSTKLQKLLAASGDFNWLPYWQSHHPSLFTGSRDESPQPRIDDADRWCRWFDDVSPDTRYGHAMEALEPDEESFLLEGSLRTACFMGWSEIPGYLGWLFTQDLSAQFRTLKLALQYLQWQGLQSPERRWVLKCPLYFGLEPLLQTEFPDVCLVMTHRHPRHTMPSSCRLLECFHQPFAAPIVNAQAVVEGLAMQIDMHVQVREARPDIRFLDVDFRDVVGDPASVLRRVYAFAGVTLTEEALGRVLRWHEANPMHKQGVHKYSLADFGLSEEMLERRFARYLGLKINGVRVVDSLR